MMPPLQCIAAGLVVAAVGFFGTFPVILQALTAMGASPAEAASGLMAASVSMGVTGIALSLWRKMPISSAWSTPGAALLAVSAMPEGGLGEAAGAFMLAGALTILAGLWPLLGRIASAVPPVIAQAMLAGVLLPICFVPFRLLPDLPGFVVPLLAVYVLVGQVSRIAAIPVTVAAAAALIALGADWAAFAPQALITPPVFLAPSFTVASTINLALPLFIVTMATQNVPAIAIMRSFGFAPRPGPLFAAVGTASVLSAPFAAPQTCLAAITSAMCAGEDSHPDPSKRYYSAVMAGLFYCLFGAFAVLLIAYAALAAPGAIAALAGIALLGVLGNAAAAALGEARTREPAALTLVVTAAGFSFLGLGAPVWGLILGVSVYLLRGLHRSA